MQWDYDKIEKTLKNMMNGRKSDSDFKLLKGAYIDYGRKKIVLSVDGNKSEFKGTNNQVKSNAQEVQREGIMICSYCGEKTAVISSTGAKCEHCGAPI